MRRLKNGDILNQIPGVQTINLEDGCLLVRHQRGTNLRSVLPVAELQRVLAVVDGQATVAEVVNKLAAEYEEADVFALLEALLGDVLAIATDQPKQVKAGNCLIWGSGEPFRRIRMLLADRDCTNTFQQMARPPDGPALEGVRLLLCLADGQPLADLFGVQQTALQAGVPALFLSGEAGQLILGPAALPAREACLACTRLSPFSAGTKSLATLLTDLGQLHTDLQASSRALAAALPQLVNQAMALLDGKDVAQYLRHAQYFSAEGEQRRRHQTRLPSCPLCGDLASGSMDHSLPQRLVSESARAQHALLERFTSGAVFTQSKATKEEHVGIIGGGTAGYLAALALRKKRPQVKVTLLYSSACPVIGVGEATTPLMPQFLHADLGLDVSEFIEQVQPTFKLGIRFNWGSNPNASFNYPFGPIRLLEPMVYENNLANCSLQSILMNAAKMPLTCASDGSLTWLGTHAMAYHVDNQRFAAYLGNKARQLGVIHQDCHIHEVEQRRPGQLEALIDRQGRRHSFDFYIDCTGFSSLLMGQAQASPFHDFGGSLFTDRAVVGATQAERIPRPYTTATALDAGWYWEIPQWHERHLGYVYCSAFCSDERAERCLRAACPGLGKTRLIHFKAGRYEHFIKGNVAALGNAYGFVEPLESTSLHLLIRQIGLLLRTFPLQEQDRGLQSTLNRQVADWWDYLSWFLALHYKFNTAMKSPFWESCRQQVDVTAFGELIEIYQQRGLLTLNASALAGFSYADPLWGAEGVDTLLLGQRLPTRLNQPDTSKAAWARWLMDARNLRDQLVDQRQLLSAIQAQPGLADQLGAIYSQIGSAFPSRITT